MERDYKIVFLEDDTGDIVIKSSIEENSYFKLSYLADGDFCIFTKCEFSKGTEKIKSSEIIIEKYEDELHSVLDRFFEEFVSFLNLYKESSKANKEERELLKLNNMLGITNAELFDTIYPDEFLNDDKFRARIEGDSLIISNGEKSYIDLYISKDKNGTIRIKFDNKRKSPFIDSINIKTPFMCGGGGKYWLYYRIYELYSKLKEIC